MSDGDAKLREFVDYLVQIGTAEAVAALEAQPDRARAVMMRIADRLMSSYARHTFYVPVGFSSRNAQIWEKYGQASSTASAFSKARVVELAAEYLLTERQVYSVLADLRAAEMAARQSTLPGLD